MDAEKQDENIPTIVHTKQSKEIPMMRNPLSDFTNKSAIATIIKSGGGSKQKPGPRSEPSAENKGVTVGEESFISDKGDQNSECSYISAASQSKSADTDTDTTADYESAGESDSSPYGSLVPLSPGAGQDANSPGREEDRTVVDGSLAENPLSITRLADDIENILRLSTPGRSKDGAQLDTSGSSTISDKSSTGCGLVDSSLSFPTRSEDIEERFRQLTSNIFSLVPPSRASDSFDRRDEVSTDLSLKTDEDLKLHLSFTAEPPASSYGGARAVDLDRSETREHEYYVVLDRTLDSNETRNVYFENESIPTVGLSEEKGPVVPLDIACTRSQLVPGDFSNIESLSESVTEYIEQLNRSDANRSLEAQETLFSTSLSDVGTSHESAVGLNVREVEECVERETGEPVAIGERVEQGSADSTDVHVTEKSVVNETIESIASVDSIVNVQAKDKIVVSFDSVANVQTVGECVEQESVDSIDANAIEKSVEHEIEPIAYFNNVTNLQAIELIKHEIVAGVDSVANLQTVGEYVKQETVDSLDDVKSVVQPIEESVQHKKDESKANVDSVVNLQAIEERIIKHEIVASIDSVVNEQTVEECVKQESVDSIDVNAIEKSKHEIEHIPYVDNVENLQAINELIKHEIVASVESVVQPIEESVKHETDESIAAVNSIVNVQAIEECIKRDSVDSKDVVESVVQPIEESVKQETDVSIAAVDSIVNVQTVVEYVKQENVDSVDVVHSIERPVINETAESIVNINSVVNLQAIEEFIEHEIVASANSIVNVQTVEECVKQESVDSKDVVQPKEKYVKHEIESIVDVDSVANLQAIEEFIEHETVASANSIVNVQTVEECVKEESVDSDEVQPIEKSVKYEIEPIADVDSVVNLQVTQECIEHETVASVDSIVNVQTVEECIEREIVDSVDIESAVRPIEESVKRVDSVVNVQATEDSFYCDTFMKQNSLSPSLSGVDNISLTDSAIVPHLETSIKGENISLPSENINNEDLFTGDRSLTRKEVGLPDEGENIKVDEDVSAEVNFVSDGAASLLERCVDGNGSEEEAVGFDKGNKPSTQPLTGGLPSLGTKSVNELDVLFKGLNIDEEVTKSEETFEDKSALEDQFANIGSIGREHSLARKPYRDMSELIATCSKQERELRSARQDESSRFDESIQQEAMKVALEIMNSPPGLGQSVKRFNESTVGSSGRAGTSDLCTEHSFESRGLRSDSSSAHGVDSTLFKLPQCMMRSAVSPDINRSEAGPVTADEHFREGESFQDATKFDFEFLSRVGSQPTGRYQARESIIVSFDPLFQAVNSTESHKLINAAMSDSAGSESESKISNDVVGGGGGATPRKAEDECEPVHKLVSITPSKSETPSRPKSAVSSLSTPPTIRQDILSKEILKLQELMIQQEQSYQEQLASTTEMLEKQKLRINELEAKDSRDTVEEKRRAAEAKLKATETKLSKVEKELADSTLSRKQLTMIMEEYEKTISQLVTKREDERQEFEQVKETIANERDSALKHLSNMEVAFNDVHQKYEKCKGVIENMKANEAAFKESIAANEKTIKKFEADYQKLKKHASEKLESANEELASLRKAHHGEVAKLKAIAKKAEIRIKGLEDSLEQKQKEVRELTQICDELIGKVEQQ